MNSLALSPAVFSYATLQGKPLPTSPVEHCSAKLVPRSFQPYKPLHRIAVFLARTKLPDLSAETKCRELTP